MASGFVHRMGGCSDNAPQSKHHKRCGQLRYRDIALDIGRSWPDGLSFESDTGSDQRRIVHLPL